VIKKVQKSLYKVWNVCCITLPLHPLMRNHLAVFRRECIEFFERFTYQQVVQETRVDSIGSYERIVLGV